MSAAPLILLTRPRAESEKLAQILESRGYRIFIEPMLIPHPLNFDQPDLQKYQALILTSAQAATSIKPAQHIPVYTVGDRTAQSARQNGFQNIHSAGGDILDLVDLLQKEITSPGKPLLYLRGAHITAPLGQALPHLVIEERITYEMKTPVTLTPHCLELLDAGRIAAALFFSRRAAAHFMQLTSENRRFPALSSIQALCLGPGMLECLRGATWAGLHASAAPDQGSLIEKLHRAVPALKGSKYDQGKR